MSILSYTVRSTYPRLFCTTDEKTALTTRTNSTASWKTEWDGVIATGIAALLSTTDVRLSTNSSGTPQEAVFQKFFLLGLWGWIENSATHHTKLLSAAKYLAQNQTIGSVWFSDDSTSKRYQELALACAYDFLRTGVITFSAADRKIIGDAMGVQCQKSYLSSEYLDGHSSGFAMSQMACALVLHGESGTGYNYTAWATGIIDGALDFWYGSAPGAVCKLDTNRYFSADGGTQLGCWYSHLDMWKCAMFLWIVGRAFTQNTESASALQLNGIDYDPFTYETWLQAIPEWVANAWLRGDKDYWTIHDTDRTSNPFFHDYTRVSTAFLITHGGSWRKHMRYVHDVIEDYAAALVPSQFSYYQLALDLVMYDPADTDNAFENPWEATTQKDKTVLFKPPGEFFHRNTWKTVDNGGSCVVGISCNERYFAGHRHCNVGAIGITVGNDVVLGGSTGMYETGDAAANYNGTHHRNWYQQSLSHSGIPLVTCNAGTHSNYIGGTRVYNLPDAGGQKFRTGTRSAATVYDVYNVSDLRFEGGGEMWHIADSTLEEDTDDFAFLYVDALNAYLPNYTAGAASPIKGMDFRYLVIKREGLYPMVLAVCRMNVLASAFPSNVGNHVGNYKTYQMHFYANPLIVPSDDVNAVTPNCTTVTAAGYRGTGKVTANVYHPSGSMWYTKSSMANPNASGYGQSQFWVVNQNFPPASAAQARYLPDLGQYTVSFETKIPRDVDWFAVLYQPRGINDAAIPFTWQVNDNWIGVRFGSSAHTYSVNKNAVQAAMSGDSSAPAAPTGLVATSLDEAVQLTWNPNTETDVDKYNVYYREKV
jgi:hypothetical protein